MPRKPESFAVADKLVRATYHRPGGRVVAFIVTGSNRKIFAHVRAGREPFGGYDVAQARAAATRFAKGCPTRRDHNNDTGPWKGDPYPSWLAFVGRWPCEARNVPWHGNRMVFHADVNIPPYDAADGRRARRPRRIRFVEVTLATAKGPPIVATVPARRVPVYVRPGAAVALTDGPSDYGVVESVHKDRCVVRATTGERVEQLWGEVAPICAAPDPSYVF